MKKYCILVLLASLLCSCDTKQIVNTIVRRDPYYGELKVKDINDPAPENSTLLGYVFVGESGMTTKKNCRYEKVYSEVCTLAKTMGGNAIAIDYKEPLSGNFWNASTCHQIKATVYWVEPQK